ncbi:MAG: PCMD domain-containing protein [Bacteroidales bacterium]|nr:PCMD domain-containing protein [Bacteroidales bacterium]
MKKQKLIAFGDSIIKGIIAEEENGSLKYKISENSATDICSRKLEIEVHNFGKFGSTITTGEKIIDKHLQRISEGDIVLLEFGGNDSDKMWKEIAEKPDFEHIAKTPLQTFVETYHRIIQKLKTTGATIYILTMPPIDTKSYFRHFTKGMNPSQITNIMKWLYGNIEIVGLWHEMYNQEIIKIACSENVELINIYKPFIKQRDYRPLFCCDGIHPNQRGQEIISDTICNAISPSTDAIHRVSIDKRGSYNRKETILCHTTVKTRFIASLILILIILSSILPLSAQTYKKVQYGDFENWVVRDIEESLIIGGETKRIYAIGPRDTIRENKALNIKSIWATSNTYAKVAGISKTSNTVYPERRGNGYCAKLTTEYAECKVIGLINIKVLVSGTIYWGKAHEPVSGTDNPYSKMRWGVPFTNKPKALVLDYKSSMPNIGTITTCKTLSSSVKAGNDEHEIVFILQNRWEDEKGNVYAKRVGTAIYHISSPTSDWVNGFRIPVIYGDARKSPNYKPYMNLGPKKDNFYTINSKGKNVEIKEVGWGDEDTPVTHAIMLISVSSQEAFSGTIGNTLWVDNIKLEY